MKKDIFKLFSWIYFYILHDDYDDNWKPIVLIFLVIIVCNMLFVNLDLYLYASFHPSIHFLLVSLEPIINLTLVVWLDVLFLFINL